MVRAVHLSPLGHCYGKLTALHRWLAPNCPSSGGMGPVPSLKDGTR